MHQHTTSPSDEHATAHATASGMLWPYCAEVCSLVSGAFSMQCHVAWSTAASARQASLSASNATKET
eukprot:971172-Amphidinium_carterae.1